MGSEMCIRDSLEPISTPEPLLDLSHLPESVLVPVLPESKSTVLSFHTPFWDEVVDKFDSEISYGIWKLDGVKFLIKILHGFIFLMGYIKDISGGFLRDPRKVDWAAFRGPIDHHRNHHLKVTIFLPFLLFHASMH